MSRKIINEILALASLDTAFREALQRDPLSAVEAQGFALTSEECQIFQEYAPLPLVEFCQRLLERLPPSPPDED